MTKEDEKYILNDMLDQIVKHFSKNPDKLRCIDRSDGVTCLYTPTKDMDKNNIGCGIGMFLPTKITKKLDVCDEDTSITNIIEDFPKLLPKWIKLLK